MHEDMEFLTANEIRSTYHIAKSTFYAKVKALGIKGELPSGKDRGTRYAPEDTEKILASLGISKSRRHRKKGRNQVIFRRARPEDAQEMHEFGEHIMSEHGEHSAPAKILLQLLSLPNSEIGHVLVKNGQIIGYFTLVPLSHHNTIQVMKRDEKSLFHQLRTRGLQPEDLARFAPGEPIDIFVWEVMSDPQQKTIGSYLLSQMLNFFHTLGKRGVEIEGVYAVATTPEGRDLCHRMGMQVMNLPEVTQPDWIPFEWKIQERKTWLTKNYIQAIKSYKKRQQRMRHEADAPAAFEDLEVE